MMARLISLAAVLAASFSGGAAGQASPVARLFNGRDLGEWIAVEQGKWK